GRDPPEPARSPLRCDPKEPPTEWVYPSDASRMPARASAARTSPSDARTTAARTAATTRVGSPSRSSNPATTPRADAATAMIEPGPVPITGTGPGVRVAVDAMGGDHGAGEGVPGALDHARAHPEDTVLLVGDEAVLRRYLTERPQNVEI